MNVKQLIAATMMAALSTVALAEEPMMVNVKRMSLETAQKIAQGAIEACRKEGIQIGVTVVDRDGIAQVVMRDTIAPTITLPISQGKAYAAVMFNVTTSDLNDRANTPIGRAPGVVMSPGGVPIQAAGSLVGGVGVSGAPSGETDEMCALKGVEQVQDDLDMS